MKKLIVLSILLILNSPSYSCEDISSLYNPEISGERRIQHDSNMCYAFSISHALSAITGRYVNPIDIVYRFKKLTGRGHGVSTLDFQLGADPTLYNDQFVGALLAQGLCSTEVPNETFALLKTEGFKREASDLIDAPFQELEGIEKFRVVQQIYRELIEDTEKTCSSEYRFRTTGIRPIGMGFRKPATVNVSPQAAIDGLDKMLEDNVAVVLNIKNSMLNNESKGYHSLTVIGRRANPKTKACEYLLLDSSSNDVCLNSANAIVDKNCQTGELWVPRERIIQHAVSLIGFRVRK